MKRNKSVMKMLKRKGPSMEPWGTPFVDSAHDLRISNNDDNANDDNDKDNYDDNDYDNDKSDTIF